MTRLSLSFLQLIQRPSCTAEGPRLASTGWCVIKHLLKGIDFTEERVQELNPRESLPNPI